MAINWLHLERSLSLLSPKMLHLPKHYHFFLRNGNALVLIKVHLLRNYPILYTTLIYVDFFPIFHIPGLETYLPAVEILINVQEIGFTTTQMNMTEKEKLLIGDT